MKRIIKFLIKKLALFFPILNVIVFESAPDLSDNTKAVFDELIKRGINNKYKCVWIVKNAKKSHPKIKNVKYVSFKSILRIWYFMIAKSFICCNDWLTTLNKRQTSFYLSHGTPIKRVRGYYTIPDKINYCFSASEDVVFLYENELLVKKEKIVSLGYPRNDVLTSADRNLEPLFKETDFEKIIVWYPTYRQHKGGNIRAGGNSLPIIHDSEKAVMLNKTAQENKVLIVLKPHFAQDVSYVKDLHLSNIKFIDDSFFEKNDITSYEFVGSCDALITDYSSIYYDYTLCDKPIALVWEDYEEYKNTIGFAEGVEEFLVGGQKIYTLSELQGFLRDVAFNNDKLKEERNKVCKLVNYSTDSKNSERVADFIIEKAKL